MKVHGRAVTKGIEPIDAGLAGHDQGAGGMGRRAGGGEGGEGQQAGQEAGLVAERRRWHGPRQRRRSPEASDMKHPTPPGCWRQGPRGRSEDDLASGGRQARMIETDPLKGVGGRDSLRRRLEAAWGGALSGLERRGCRIDGL